MPSQQHVAKGRIGIVTDPRSDLIFQYNPHEIDRDRTATYANNQAALADFPNAPTDAIPPIQWIRNEAEDFSIEVFFIAFGDDDVEDTLKKLDFFMKPDRRTGEPPDLVLVMGPRTDRVRILQKHVKEILFTEANRPNPLRVQHARVSLRLKALRSRSA